MKNRFSGLCPIVAAALLLVGACQTVHATDGVRPLNYVQGQAGAFEPSDDLDDGDFDTGFNTSLSYGRYLTRNLIIEGTIDYFYVDRDVSGSNAVAGTFTMDEDLSVTAALVTLKGEVSLGAFDLFGGVGVGLYGAYIESEVDTTAFGSFDDDDFDAVFGGHVSAGGNYNINAFWFVGLEARYRWTDDVELDESFATIPFEYKGNLNGYSLAATVGYRF